MSGRAVDSADLAALPVARNSLRASSMPAPPPCRLPEIHCGRPVCLPRPAASVARNSLRASSVPAPPRCRLVSYPKCISGAWCACPAPLPPGQLPEIHFGRPVCLPRPAASVARNSFRASSVPAPPRCRLVSYPKCISGVQYACPAPLPPGQSPEMYFGRPVCLPRPAAARSVARNSFRTSSVPAPPPCRLVSCPKFISGAWCACPAPLPPGQLPEIHFGRPVCLPCPAAAWSVARNSFRASSMPAPPRCVSCPKFISGVQYACPAPLRQSPEIHFGRPVCLHRPAAAWSVARNSFRASSVPAPPRCVSCPKFISGVQCACTAPLRQSPEIHCGRPVCLPRCRLVSRPKFISGVQYACPAPLPVARNSLRASSVPAPPRCVSRPKFIAGVQYACPAPLRQSPEIHCGRPVCLPRPPAGCPKFIAGVQCACPAPLRQSPEIHCGRPVCLPRPAAGCPKFIAGVQCACPAPLRQSPEIHCGRPVCLPRPAAAWSVTRNVFRAPGVPAPPRCRLVSYPKCISGVWCACPAPLSQRTIFTPPVPAAI
jgi:hypothetical protein